MQTQEKPIQIARTKPPRPTRRLVPALAAAMALIVAAAGVWAITRSDEPSIAERTPLEVVELFNEAVAKADFEAAAGLYADGTTIQFLTPDNADPTFALSDPLPEQATVLDWNGDGVLTEWDQWLWNGADLYAGGTTKFLSCTQSDPIAVVCEEVREGFAFLNPGHQPEWTVTIVDGLITHVEVDLSAGTSGTSPGLVALYRSWVNENRPEAMPGLFAGPNQLNINPDTIHRHRELVAEWQASR